MELAHEEASKRIEAELAEKKKIADTLSAAQVTFEIVFSVDALVTRFCDRLLTPRKRLICSAFFAFMVLFQMVLRRVSTTPP